MWSVWQTAANCKRTMVSAQHTRGRFAAPAGAAAAFARGPRSERRRRRPSVPWEADDEGDRLRHGMAEGPVASQHDGATAGALHARQAAPAVPRAGAVDELFVPRARQRARQPQRAQRGGGGNGRAGRGGAGGGDEARGEDAEQRGCEAGERGGLLHLRHALQGGGSEGFLLDMDTGLGKCSQGWLRAATVSTAIQRAARGLTSWQILQCLVWRSHRLRSCSVVASGRDRAASSAAGAMRDFHMSSYPDWSNQDLRAQGLQTTFAMSDSLRVTGTKAAKRSAAKRKHKGGRDHWGCSLAA